MYIANPIYDVVFKYLMEDAKVARLLISSIIGQEIELLDFSPKEFTVNIDETAIKTVKKYRKKKKDLSTLTVYRLDFAAKIKTPEGEKIVTIEIQKAKFAGDIMRFRRYLGDQYSNKKNVYEVIDEDGIRHEKACEIISIYFLGHELDNIRNIPVVKSPKTYIDVGTGKEINVKEYFIDSLNHESYTILIPALKAKRRNELEILLSVFDQSNCTDDDHILNVQEEDFQQKYRPLIRRLQKAASEPDVRKTMDLEDDIIGELAAKERNILMQKDIIRKERKLHREEEKKALKTIEEKEKTIEEKEKTIEEKEKTIEEKEKTIEEKEKTIEEKEKTIEALKDALENLRKLTDSGTSK